MVVALALAVAPAAARAQGAVELAPDADPNDWEAYFDVGVEKIRRAPSDAAAAFTQASLRDPTRAEPLFARWVAFWLSQTVADFSAYRRYDEAMLKRPEVRAADSLYSVAVTRNPFVHRGLEVMLYDRGQRLLTTADSRGWAAYSAGDFIEAVRVYTRAVERDPTGSLWQRRERALSYVGLGDLRRAVADLRFVLDELRRRDEAASEISYYASKHGLLHMIGLIHARLGETGPARDAFAEAMVEDAGFAPAHAATGALARSARDFAAAVTAYEQAVFLAPDDAVIRFGLGQALLEAGRADSAVVELERVTVAEPMWAQPYLLLARAYERRGRPSDARVAYERFLARTTRSDPQARSVRTRLGIPQP